MPASNIKNITLKKQYIRGKKDFGDTSFLTDSGGEEEDGYPALNQFNDKKNKTETSRLYRRGRR